MISNKKYLFYDDIVRGAGIGHTLCSYIFGLELSKKINLEYLPCKIKPGHGLSDIEKYLGLQNFEERREQLIKSNPNEIFHIKYNKNFSQSCVPMNSWNSDQCKFIQDKYGRAKHPDSNYIKKDFVNIAVSIRRGDVVHYKSSFKNRLMPDSFYRNSISFLLSSLNIDKYFINIFSDGALREAHYVNENGEHIELEKLIPEFHDNASMNLSDHSGGSTPGLRNITFDHMWACVNSDIFLGSISGFSELICILRSFKNCYMPSKKLDGKLICLKNEF
tara:strand:- start:16234 stop:17061 length:828 start_codon:yes stop_codon:yes gene_type:complete